MVSLLNRRIYCAFQPNLNWRLSWSWGTSQVSFLAVTWLFYEARFSWLRQASWTQIYQQPKQVQQRRIHPCCCFTHSYNMSFLRRGAIINLAWASINLAWANLVDIET